MIYKSLSDTDTIFKRWLQAYEHKCILSLEVLAFRYGFESRHALLDVIGDDFRNALVMVRQHRRKNKDFADDVQAVERFMGMI